MSLCDDDIQKIAWLARLEIRPEDCSRYAGELSGVLEFVARLEQVDTAGVTPMAHPTDASQRLREDIVTETSQREKFQQIAPKAEQGLYLVPKVIE